MCVSACVSVANSSGWSSSTADCSPLGIAQQRSVDTRIDADAEKKHGLGLGARLAGWRVSVSPGPGALPSPNRSRRRSRPRDLSRREREGEPCARVCRTRATRRRVFFALFPPRSLPVGIFPTAERASGMSAGWEEEETWDPRGFDGCTAAFAGSLGPRTGSLPENVQRWRPDETRPRPAGSLVFPAAGKRQGKARLTSFSVSIPQGPMVLYGARHRYLD